MIVRITNQMWAEGTPTELGQFTAVYMASFVSLYDGMKTKMAENQLLQKIAEEFRGIQIREIPKKDGGKKDAGK